MGRIYYYVMFAVTLAILVEISGLSVSSQSGLLQKVGLFDIAGGDVSSDSDFLAEILLVIGVVVGAGLTIGLFTRLNENFLMASLISGFLTIVFFGALWDIIIITSGYENYIRVPMIILIAPFTMGYLISLYEYIRGNV